MKKHGTLILGLTLTVLLQANLTQAQVNVPSSTWSGIGYIGWSTAGGPVPFQIAGTKYMELATSGFVGIGPGFSANYQLDVDAGDININQITNGYRIGGSGASVSDLVLWHAGNTNNIFVGVGAGNSTGSGTRNTFAGNNSGLLIGGGDDNSFFGYHAGTANTTGYSNPRWA